MKVAHVFNLRCGAYTTCKGLRRIGVEADLFLVPGFRGALPQWEDATMFPQWEDGGVDLSALGNIFSPNLAAFDWSGQPDWVHVVRPEALPAAFRRLDEYDVVVGHYPFEAAAADYIAECRTPYLVYDAGRIRYPFSPREADGYRQADKVLYSNTDTAQMFERIGVRRVAYSPLPIDTKLYYPQFRRDPDKPIFLHPTRQNWEGKGNDRLLRAFARYVHRVPESTLIAAEWGETNSEVRNAKALLDSLGVAKNVHWIGAVPKYDLVSLICSSTAVFDQFVLGAVGTTTPEAMACGTAVVANVTPSFWVPHHQTVPPVVQATTEEEIYAAMLKLEDAEFRRTRGKLGRQWVIENDSAEVVARGQLPHYEAAAKKHK